MNKNFQYPDNHLLDINAIPKVLHGNEISEANLERIASGLQSGLIKDFIMDDKVVDVKLSAHQDKKGDIIIDYDEKHQQLEIPNKVFNQTLSDAQKELLMNNELLGPIRYKGQDYFIGVDDQLNKVTVKSSREMGIADTVANYQLNGVDKYYIAAGRATDLRVFKTEKGDHFTAKIKQTSDKKGMEFLNIKFIDAANAPKLIEQLNKDNTITDPKFMLHMVGLKSKDDISPDRVIDGTYPVLSKTVYDIDNGINKQQFSNNEKNASVYEKVKGTGDSFSIKADVVFAPKKFKGVQLTKQQQQELTQGQDVFLKGVKHNNKSLNGHLKMDKTNKIFSFTAVKGKSKEITKQITKEKDGIER